MGLLPCFLLALLFGWGQSLSADVLYIVTDLGTLGGSNSSGEGINSSAQVVGESSTSSGLGHGFLYSNGQITDLGVRFASAINDQTQVTGAAYTPSFNVHAFVYSNGQTTDLGTLGGSDSFGSGINNTGQVTGYARIPGTDDAHAFIYTNGQMTDLGVLPGGTSSEGLAINKGGQVTGSATTSGAALFGSHAFIYSGGRMTDLGTLGGVTSVAYGINDSGQVVGYSDASGGAGHAFLFTNGRMLDLGFAGSGFGINNAGQIVGSVGGQGPFSSSNRAFLYNNGVTLDLNDAIDPGLNLTLLEARAINDSGQIVANGTSTNAPPELAHTFLLTPIATPVSEPSTLRALAVTGLILCLLLLNRSLRAPFSRATD